jgi:hypothetical protein
MKVKWKFNFEIWEEFFIFDGKNVTNIVEYNWNVLIPKKKL